mgnify:FL=1
MYIITVKCRFNERQFNEFASITNITVFPFLTYIRFNVKLFQFYERQYNENFTITKRKCFPYMMAKSCICELYLLGLINNKYVINEVSTVFCSPLFATTRQAYCPQHRLVTPIVGVRLVCCVPTGSALETQILTLPSVRNKPTFKFSSESRTTQKKKNKNKLLKKKK